MGPALPGPVTYRPWQPSPSLLRRIDALVLSIEDVKGDEALVAGYARHCALVALTRGAQGSTLFFAAHRTISLLSQRSSAILPVPAMSLLPRCSIRLRETGEPLEAARFASYVAALSVEGAGISRMPARDEIEHGLQRC